MAEPTVTIMCPKLTCRAVLQVPEKVRGKKVRCARCNTCFEVPSTAPASTGQGTVPPSRK